MAEEIKNDVENENNEKAEKVKLTVGQKLDKAIDGVKTVPKKIVGGGKKAAAAVGIGLLTAFAGGALLGSKGYFTANDGQTPELIGDGETIEVQPDVIDVEPEVMETEEEV